MKTIRSSLVVGSVCTLSLLVASSAESEPRLQGDPEAVAAIERMIDRFGGQAVWATARSLYVEYEGWRLEPNEPVVERAWRDFEEPLMRSEYEGRSFYTVSVITPERSWDLRSGELSYRSDEAHRARITRYPFSFYVSLHSFASADQRIRLEWEEPGRVRVRDDDGNDWGYWKIDDTGALIAWGVTTANGTFEYVYGPMRAFGNINFPAWGASLSGSWRFDYRDVDVSTERLTIPVDPPE